jgi:hypothetical protein
MKITVALEFLLFNLVYIFSVSKLFLLFLDNRISEELAVLNVFKKLRKKMPKNISVSQGFIKKTNPIKIKRTLNKRNKYREITQ